MKTRISALAAIAAAVSIIGCIVATSARSIAGDGPPAPGVSNSPVPTTRPYRGIVMQLQSLDDLPGYKKAVDEIADTGADTISLVTPLRQENGSSAEIVLDYSTSPRPKKLGELIDYCKHKNLRVCLLPSLLLSHPVGGEFRGRIKPPDWAVWFDSYRRGIDMYAQLAQEHHVDLFVVGAELASSEQNLEEWTKTIDSIRKVFKGNLTYSANWDHYREIPFWNQLDEIGMNCYYKLGDGPDVTVDEAKRAWVPIHDTLMKFAGGLQRPLIFLEVGWCSTTNAAENPWDYTKDELPVDNELQENLYKAFLETWYGDGGLGGFIIQEWIPGPPAAKGYTPEGKPAEQVLRSYFAKPPWKVDSPDDQQ